MKKLIQQYAALLLTIVLIIGVCGLYSYRKSGMFVDEIYTYGLSNGYYTPFVKSITDGDMTDHTISRQELLDYLTVGDNDRFAFGSVYYNQTQDVHPPLYYWLFHLASSLVPGTFSKWTGLCLDFILYSITLLLLYRLLRLLFAHREIAVCGLALYGLSTVGLSTMLMIRMYVLLTLFSVLLAYLILHQIRSPRAFLYPLIGLTIFAGLLTQYYFVFYAFFLCLTVLIYLAARKEWKAAGIFSGCAIGGVILLPIAFPAFLKQLTANALVSGGSALKNLTTTAKYADRLHYYFDKVSGGLLLELRAALLPAGIALILCIIFLPRALKVLRSGSDSNEALLFVLPAAAAFCLVAVIAPVTDHRYVFNVMPFFVVFVCWLLWLAESALPDFNRKQLLRQAAVFAVALWALWNVRTFPPQYLYDSTSQFNHNEYNAAISDYTDCPCVYLTDNANGVVTQDLLQLMQFPDVFFTNDPSSEALKDYLANHSANHSLVVYVDISKEWGSGYDSVEMIQELLDHTEYNSAEPLYQYELSDTYVLQR